MRILTIFLLLLPIIQVHGQSKLNDARLKNPADTLMVLEYIAKAKGHRLRQPDSSFYYLDKAETLANQLKFYPGIIQVLMARYSIDYLNNDTESAYQNVRRAFSLSVQQNLPYWQARSSSQLGHYFTKETQYDSAYHYLISSINVFENNGEPENAAMSYSNLSAYYLEIKDTAQAEKSLLKAMELSEQSNNRMDIGVNLYHLINLYTQMERWEERAAFIEKYLKFSLENTNLQNDFDFFHRHIFFKNNSTSLDKKIHQLLQDIETHEQYNNLYGLYYSYLFLAELYVQNQQPEAAEAIYLKVLDLPEVLVNKRKALVLFKSLAEFYEHTNKPNEAFSYYKKFMHLKDSLYAVELITKGQEMEVKYETAEKEAQLARQETQLVQQAAEQQKLSYALLALGILAGIITLFLAYRNKHVSLLRSKNAIIKKALSEKNLLLKEIHHRVKNNLQVISGLLKWQSSFIEDSKALNAFNEGQNRVQSMAIIHQKLYQTDNLTGIEMDDYIQRLSQSLFRSYNIKPGQVSLKTDIESLQLDIDTVIPLGLILNELISNALKHAFPNNRPGEIAVKLYRDEMAQELLLSINDNGVGMEVEDKEKQKQSFGWELIETLSKKLKAHLIVHNDKGTHIQLRIKNYKMA